MIAQRLPASARGRLVGAFLAKDAGASVSRLGEPFSRPIDLGPLAAVIDAAMTDGRFQDRQESDAWLAPRVHAALRLTRREAAQSGLWDHLGLIDFPDYVDWRWKREADGLIARQRLVGEGTNQALARLWWGAEFTRNGPDYTLVADAFRVQDIPNTWFRLDLFHNRIAAISSIRLMASFKDGRFATGDQVNALATALRTTLRTTSIEALAPTDTSDAHAVRDWIARAPEVESLLRDELPVGPGEAVLRPEALQPFEEFIEDLVVRLRLRDVVRATHRAASEGPEE